MKSAIETYKGRQIFYAHYDHLSLEQLNEEAVAVKKELESHPMASPLVLVDVTGTIISPAVLEIFKDMASFGGKHKAKTAVLGITGVRRTFMEIIKNFSSTSAVPFDDAESAKDWLVS